MEGRMTLFLALGLVTGMAGCSNLQTPQPQGAPIITIGTLSDPPSGSGKQIDKPVGAGPHVAAGEYFMREAEGKGKSPALQQELYDKARKYFQKAIQIDPSYTPAYRSLATLYVILEDPGRAIQTYQTALKHAPKDAQVWYELGMCCCRRKDFAHGVTALTRACELEPENHRMVKALGYTLARMGRYDDSLACFCRVLPRAKAHYNLARMLEVGNQLDLCKYHLQCALQDDPTLEAAQTMLVKITTGKSPEVQPASYQEMAADVEPQAPVAMSPYARTATSPTMLASAPGAPSSPMLPGVQPLPPETYGSAPGQFPAVSYAANATSGVAPVPSPAPPSDPGVIATETAGGIQPASYEFEQDSATLAEDTDLLPPPPATVAAAALATETARVPLPRFAKAGAN